MFLCAVPAVVASVATSSCVPAVECVLVPDLPGEGKGKEGKPCQRLRAEPGPATPPAAKDGLQRLSSFGRAPRGLWSCLS